VIDSRTQGTPPSFTKVSTFALISKRVATNDNNDSTCCCTLFVRVEAVLSSCVAVSPCFSQTLLGDDTPSVPARSVSRVKEIVIFFFIPNESRPLNFSMLSCISSSLEKTALLLWWTRAGCNLKWRFCKKRGLTFLLLAFIHLDEMYL